MPGQANPARFLARTTVLPDLVVIGKQGESAHHPNRLGSGQLEDLVADPACKELLEP